MVPPCLSIYLLVLLYVCWTVLYLYIIPKLQLQLQFLIDPVQNASTLFSTLPFGNVIIQYLRYPCNSKQLIDVLFIAFFALFATFATRTSQEELNHLLS
jgi:hypothetical protein